MEYTLVFTVTSVMMIQTYTHTGKMSILMKDMLENSYILMTREE